MQETMQVGALGRAAEDIRVALMTSAVAIPAFEQKRGPDPLAPRLITRRSKTNHKKFILYIRDGQKEISTRLPPSARADAQILCDLYTLQKGAKERAIVAPRMVRVVAALAHAFEALRPIKGADKTAHRNYLMLATRLATLTKFFGDLVFKDVTTAKCKEFIEWRTTLRDARYSLDNPEAPLAQEASAREDLYELSKAIDLYANEHALAWHPEVYLPKAGPGRTRWLRPVEIDRIYWAIRGRIWDHRTGTWEVETVADDDGNVVTRRVLRSPEQVKSRKPLRRLVFIGLSTGTRNAAMRELSWYISDEGGCFDLEAGLIHRRGFGLDPALGKPRASSQVGERVVTTLRRFRKADLAAGIHHVIHKTDGSPYATSPSWIWKAVMADAGLGDDVVPHTLRHTAATFLRLAGDDVRKSADLLGMSVQTMVRVYGQWTLQGQEAAAETLADLRGLRRSVPLLELVPSVRFPEVASTPVVTPVDRPASSDRRHLPLVRTQAVSGLPSSGPDRPRAQLARTA
jgi:integrase